MIKNKVKIKGKMVLIELNRKSGDALFSKVDLDTFRTLIEPLTLRWQARWSESAQTFYCQARISYNPSKFVQLHRLVLGISERDWREIEAHHVNNDGLDNRSSNLEAVTHGLNQAKIRTPKHNTSGYKNVTWDNFTGKWQGGFQITKKGYKRKFIGCGHFDDPRQAYEAVQARRKKEGLV